MQLRLITAGLLLAPALVIAADWPQWRGPDRNEISRETDLRTSFDGDGPKLLWTYSNAGNAYSGPAIVGNVLYSQGADRQEFAFALNTDTGEEIWRVNLGRIYQNRWGGGPRGTPTVDGDRLYLIRGNGEVHCLSTKDGKELWKVEMQKDLGGELMSGWGYSESPLVDGDKVIVTPGGRQGALAALDKMTGKVIWRSKEWTHMAAYSSPIVADVHGVRTYIQMTAVGNGGPAAVIGVAADDGRLLWSHQRRGRTAVIPTPIYHDGHVYTTTGYGAGCQLLKITRDGDKFKAEEVYANNNMVNHHGGVVLYEGHIYGHSDGRGWVCQDFKTGENKWEAKGRGTPGKGSLTFAAGHLFCYDERSGQVHVAVATPEAWKQTGLIKLPKQSSIRSPSGGIWTHPVIANGKLYLRDQDLLFCLDVSK